MNKREQRAGEGESCGLGIYRKLWCGLDYGHTGPHEARWHGLLITWGIDDGRSRTVTKQADMCDEIRAANAQCGYARHHGGNHGAWRVEPATMQKVKFRSGD